MEQNRRPFRLLTIGHSYAIALNRRLANEMAAAGQGSWEVTCAAPEFLHGDLRPVRFEPSSEDICPIETVPLRFSRKAHVMLYGRQLRHLLQRPWDLIHCWQEPFIFAGGQIARWRSADSKLVFASFQNISKKYPPPFDRIERYSMSRAAGWIAFGHTVEQALQERPGYSPLPHRVIPLGADTTHFKPDPVVRAATLQTLNWRADGPPVVGFLGRFVPEKGLGLLMQTLNAIDDPWRAMFVGGGPMEVELREWAKTQGDRVRIVTGIPHAGVPPYLNAMDMLCAPSQTRPNWREQLGRMLLEAFASGVPVIASDSGEIPYVVSKAGMIVPEADAAAWQAAIRRLLREPETRKRFAERGSERAKEEFAWPLIAHRHLDFFRELLDRSHP